MGGWFWQHPLSVSVLLASVVVVVVVVVVVNTFLLGGLVPVNKLVSGWVSPVCISVSSSF